ncbi:MAG: rhodanese-like domain-containing protein [Betaproteobacteria bacterium]|nr:rhodanese-like domain-containing protein [Betaproteobacteria bacterium]MDH3436792.1 rhodanese-like domain-containing protein [Betaproteobacteria bacterium]
MNEFLVFLGKSPFNMVLLGVVLASGGMLVWPLVSRVLRRTSEVGTIEAVQLINRRDAVVLDVRETGDFATGHIANARHIPEVQLNERIGELERFKSRPIIVSCRTGSRAPAVASALRKRGFEEAVGLRGGIAAWQQASLPLQKR